MAEARAATRYRWTILRLTFVAQLSNALAAQAVAPLAPIFQPELGLNQTAIPLAGIVAATALPSLALVAGWRSSIAALGFLMPAGGGVTAPIYWDAGLLLGFVDRAAGVNYNGRRSPSMPAAAGRRLGGTLMIGDAQRQLLLSIARCPHARECLANEQTSHLCSDLVAAQKTGLDGFHLPEPWSGALEAAPVLFLGSNPGYACREEHPLWSWSDDTVVAFFEHRFGGGPRDGVKWVGVNCWCHRSRDGQPRATALNTLAAVPGNERSDGPRSVACTLVCALNR